MAHSRGEGGGTGGTAPKPNPSDSAGQASSHMELTQTNRPEGMLCVCVQLYNTGRRGRK